MPRVIHDDYSEAVGLRHLGLMLALTCSVVVGTCSVAVAQSVAEPVEIEVLPVLELPVTINKPLLIKGKNGYRLKCSLTNGSEFRQLGFRYSLAIVDATGANRIVTRSEGFTLLPYHTRDITFKTPLQLNIKDGERVVLMLEQNVSVDYVWEVIKGKETLADYLAGDYSKTPRVLRVRNQVDAPPRPKLLY